MKTFVEIVKEIQEREESERSAETAKKKAVFVEHFSKELQIVEQAGIRSHYSLEINPGIIKDFNLYREWVNLENHGLVVRFIYRDKTVILWFLDMDHYKESNHKPFYISGKYHAYRDSEDLKEAFLMWLYGTLEYYNEHQDPFVGLLDHMKTMPGIE